MTEAYTAARSRRFPQTSFMREEARRIDERLEATLRIPDVEPTAIVVIAHALPTHGGTMRTPIMAAIARACAERGWYALRFNFRGVGASAGEWSGGRYETDDLAAAVDYARTGAPGLPLGLVGHTFGAFQILSHLERGGRGDAGALVGVGTKDPSFAPRALPTLPAGPFIVADYHMLTTRLDKLDEIGENIRDDVLDNLAVGVDPEAVTIYLQSLVPEVTELHLYFSMLVTVPRAQRIPTLKDQMRDHNIAQPSYGLLGYPILQAADILCVKGDLVPVGRDNESHVELTREIARRFNELFAPVSPIPASLIP